MTQNLSPEEYWELMAAEYLDELSVDELFALEAIAEYQKADALTEMDVDRVDVPLVNNTINVGVPFINGNREARVPFVNGNRRVRRRRENVVRPYSREAFSLIVTILRENVTLINSNCSRLFRIVNLMIPD